MKLNSLIIFIAFILSACVNINSVQFGSSRLELESVRLTGQSSYYHYTNYKENIIILVSKENIKNAEKHLQTWMDSWIKREEKHRGAKLEKKETNGISYYETIDKKLKFKSIYIFGTNDENNAVFAKISKFPMDTEISTSFIKNMYEMKIN